MNITILGGAGFVGSHLSKAYLDVGHNVTIIDNLSYADEQGLDPRARFCNLDIRDSRLHGILEQERPDVLSYHVGNGDMPAVQKNPLANADIHIRGLLNVLASIPASLHKIIFASSAIDMYASASTRSLKEDASLQPQTPEAIAAYTGESYVRYYAAQHRIEYTIFRYAHIYGDTRSSYGHDVVCDMANALQSNQKIVLRTSATAQQDLIFVDDVVHANAAVLQSGRNQTYHIGSGQAYSMQQIIEIISDTIGEDIQKGIQYIQPVDEHVTVLDTSLAQSQLGWTSDMALDRGIYLTLTRMGLLTGIRKESQLIAKTIPLTMELDKVISLAPVAA
jgi:UDP-glucose 4-epimerase